MDLAYDANGNLESGDGFCRVYNELNQLVRVYEGNECIGSPVEEYVWHPTEERILIKDTYEGGDWKESIYYVSDEFIRIENSSGNYTEKYLYQDETLVAHVSTDGNKQFLHPDHLGSTSLITDSDGNVLEDNIYSPFGEQLEFGGSRFGYEGKEFDSVTQDIDFHFRKYKPDWGRFTQPDTLVKNAYYPQSLNRYALELNNPIKHLDPSGHTIQGFLESGLQTTVGSAEMVAGGGILLTTGITGVGAVIGVAMIIDGALATASGLARASGSFSSDAERDRQLMEKTEPLRSLPDLGLHLLDKSDLVGDGGIGEDLSSNSISLTGSIYKGLDSAKKLRNNVAGFLVQVIVVRQVQHAIREYSPGGYFDSTHSISFVKSKGGGSGSVICRNGDCFGASELFGEKFEKVLKEIEKAKGKEKET